MRRVEIIAIGDELLSGETVDTNSSYLDDVLEGWGWTVTRHQTVGDDLSAIARAFTESSARAEVVLSTGGLGPTQDDLTLQALAQALGCDLRKDEPTLGRIRAMFAKFGREMSPNNERQALVPEIGEVVDNDMGTAPAFLASLNGAKVFLMPGVPREVKWLTENQLKSRIGTADTQRLRRTLKVVGVGESRLEHTIRDVVRKHERVRFGFRTRGIENHIKLMAVGNNRKDFIAAAEVDLLEILGDKIFGADDDALSEVVGRLLKDRGCTIAVAESCTGGLISKMLTDIPGSSEYFLGGAVSYAYEAKTEMLGVAKALIEKEGAVSEPVVAQMAQGIRSRLASDYALAVSGIAGPGGATPDKPVGTVCLAVTGPGTTATETVQLPGDRDRVRDATARLALQRLRTTILAT